MKWQADKIIISWNGNVTNGQVYKNDNVKKCLADQVASWQNGKLTKWQMEEMANWGYSKLTKW